ncbi:MAG: ribokinase [Clostridia bacterium]|nr:ribokinase [Clostridia bacterium]
MEKRILVVSSANMDFVMNMRTIPSAGQTLIDNGSYRFIPGGKGANSAVAIRRLGGDCVFCTRLGNDANGALLSNLYKKEGIDTRFIARDDNNATGLAAIMVEENGVNRIVVYPGANLAITSDDIDNAMTCYPDALFMQLEIDPEAIIYAANCASKAGVPIFIDAGPATKAFPLDRLPPLEVFSPNETETEIFTGISPSSPENCLRAAIALSKIVNAHYYVIKLGGRGVYIYDGLYYHCLPAYDTKVVDTTAAGDAFTAAFTLEYLRSGDVERAGKYGNAVGSITVSRAGAYTSLPTANEVAGFIKARGIKL